MLIIAHRALTEGPNSEIENTPGQIRKALSCGFDVEIDVWMLNGKLFLGHDEGKYPVNKEFFYNNKMWVHCKNPEALVFLYENPLINCFFHDKDDCVLTSKNFLWTYIGKRLTNRSIAVLPELAAEDYNPFEGFGICTDYPFKYKELSEKQ